MKRIVLNYNTLKTIMRRLRKITSGFYTLHQVQDVNPLTCYDWGESFPTERTAMADISKHSLIDDQLGRHSKDKNAKGFPIIHMAIDAECGEGFCIGDVFFFDEDDENTVIINQKHGSFVKSMDAQNVVIKLTAIKRWHQLTEAEKKEIQAMKRFAEESLEVWRRLDDKEMEREIEEEHGPFDDLSERDVYNHHPLH